MTQNKEVNDDLKICDDYNGITRVIPEQEMFLVWMLQKTLPNTKVQKMIFDNYPVWQPPKPFEEYEIKRPERICLGCKKQITGNTIIPTEEGFYCNPSCFARNIFRMSDEALDTLTDLGRDLGIKLGHDKMEKYPE